MGLEVSQNASFKQNKCKLDITPLGNYNVPYLLHTFKKIHIKGSIIRKSYNNVIRKLFSGTLVLPMQEKNKQT